MNASKCSYIIFSKAGSRNKDRMKLNLSNGLIPYDSNPKFLGVIFDEFLNFKKHTENLEKRARKRLNLIKIFSHKSWRLGHEKYLWRLNWLHIYIFFFYSFLRIAATNMERLQRVQNRAIRSIYRLEWTSPTCLIHTISNLLPIRERLIKLVESNLAKAQVNNEYVILLLQEYTDPRSSIRRKEKDTPLIFKVN